MYVFVVCLLFTVSKSLPFIIATREGFSLAYTTNTTNPKCENGSVVVFVDFMCYPDAVWSSSQLDVSDYLLFFLAVPTDTCLVRTLLYLVLLLNHTFCSSSTQLHSSTVVLVSNLCQLNQLSAISFTTTVQLLKGCIIMNW